MSSADCKNQMGKKENGGAMIIVIVRDTEDGNAHMREREREDEYVCCGIHEAHSNAYHQYGIIRSAAFRIL